MIIRRKLKLKTVRNSLGLLLHPKKLLTLTCSLVAVEIHRWGSWEPFVHEVWLGWINRLSVAVTFPQFRMDFALVLGRFERFETLKRDNWFETNKTSKKPICKPETAVSCSLKLRIVSLALRSSNSRTKINQMNLMGSNKAKKITLSYPQFCHHHDYLHLLTVG